MLHQQTLRSASQIHSQCHPNHPCWRPVRPRRQLCHASTSATDAEPTRSSSSSSSSSSSTTTSFIPETLKQLQEDAEFQATLAAVAQKGQQQLTREESRARKRSLQHLNLPAFGAKLQEAGLEPLRRGTTTTLQLNIGLYCNQACNHCHVESSPLRTEMMDRATADRCLQLLAGCDSVSCLDITGGAPELNTEFRYLVSSARALRPQQLDIIDRCNLTVLCEPGQEDLPQFLAEHKVHVIASLPCYGAGNVDQQRGRGVFERSIEGLQALNAVGYGQPGTGLQLDLVYNPGGAFLAPSREQLEPAYKQELREAHGIEFTSLLCLNNMPIKRFADFLLRNNKLTDYMQLLVNAFNPATVKGLMCTNTLSVAWDGQVFDCDFNQQLALGMLPSGPSSADVGFTSSSGSSSSEGGSDEELQQQQQPGKQLVSPRKGLTVWDVESLDELSGRRVVVDSHCYGCTAGSGSGCQGATA